MIIANVYFLITATNNWWFLSKKVIGEKYE